MAYETIALTVADRIATITVNRPDKLNALNDRVIAELGDAIELARADSTVGGIILTGVGRSVACPREACPLCTSATHVVE